MRHASAPRPGPRTEAARVSVNDLWHFGGSSRPHGHPAPPPLDAPALPAAI